MRISSSALRPLAFGAGLGLLSMSTIIGMHEKNPRDLDERCAEAELYRRGVLHCSADPNCFKGADFYTQMHDNVTFVNEQCHPLGRVER
jgi:hypothetical protein